MKKLQILVNELQDRVKRRDDQIAEERDSFTQLEKKCVLIVKLTL